MDESEYNYVHFYWAGGIPPLEARRNLHRWALHLSDTRFIPILWCNQSTFDELKSKGGTGSFDDFKGHFTSPKKLDSIKALRSIFTRQLPVIGEDFCYFYFRFFDYNLSCILVINVEYFFLCYAKYIETREDLASQEKKVFAEKFFQIIAVYRSLNKIKLYAMTKDVIIPRLLSMFGGFYSDIDIKPTTTPFFDSLKMFYERFFKLMPYSFFDEVIQKRGIRLENMVQAKIPVIFSMLRSRVYESDPTLLYHYYDVGFLFCINPLNGLFFYSSDTIQPCYFGQLIEEAEERDKETIERTKRKMKTEGGYYPNYVLLSTFRERQLIGIFKKDLEKGTSLFGKEMQDLCSNAYKHEERPSFELYKILSSILNLIYFTFPYPGCDKRVEWMHLQKNYFNTYRTILSDKFIQPDYYEPSSAWYTGYHTMLAQYRACRLIEERRLARRLPQTGPILSQPTHGFQLPDDFFSRE